MYENKQFKEGLEGVQSILDKHPNHGGPSSSPLPPPSSSSCLHLRDHLDEPALTPAPAPQSRSS